MGLGSHLDDVKSPGISPQVPEDFPKKLFQLRHLAAAHVHAVARQVLPGVPEMLPGLWEFCEDHILEPENQCRVFPRGIFEELVLSATFLVIM